jgi:outer membrane protein insertion porin family
MASVDLTDDHVRVKNVIIEGNDHTADSFIYRKVKSVPEAGTIQTLNDRIAVSVHELQSSGLFNSIQVFVDSAEAGDLGDVDVIFDLKEKSRFAATLGAFQTTDGSSTTGQITGEMRNIIGHGEGLTVTCSAENEGLGGLSFSSARASLHSLPLFGDSRTTNSVSVYKEVVNKSYYSSLTGSASGVSAGVAGSDSRHSLEVESAYRRFSVSAEHAGLATPEVVAETLAPTVKNSLRYGYRADSRTGDLVPSDGTLQVAKVEVAGLGGDVAFLKAEAHTQYVRPLAPGSLVTVALALRAGIIRSWDAISRLGSLGSGSSGAAPADRAYLSNEIAAAAVKAPAVPIADRFFHNNLFVRGFTPRDVSPQDSKSNALGGDTYASASLSLSAPIPRYERLALRPQLFANIGTMSAAHPTVPVGAAPGAAAAGFSSLGSWLGLDGLARNVQASVGAGLVLPTAFGRLELNLASPVYNKGGKVALQRPGFSIGLSLDW